MGGVELRDVDRREGSERQDHPGAGRCGAPGDRAVLGMRHLHLEEQRILGRKAVLRHLRRGNPRIGAGRDEDGVLAVIVDARVGAVETVSQAVFQCAEALFDAGAGLVQSGGHA